MVDRAGAELERQRDGAGLRELIAVEAQGETGVAARRQIPPRLGRVERAPLEEDVGRIGDARRLRQHLAEREVEVLVRGAELGGNGVGAEPRRDAPRRADGPERRELRVPIEPVAGLALPSRRAGAQHPAAVPLDGSAKAVLAGCAGGADGREDAAAGGVELLVACASGAQGELAHAVAAERRMRVAVDESRNGAESAPVDLLDLVVDRAEVAHAPDRRDSLIRTEQVRVLEHLDLREGAPAERRSAAGRADELGEVADEEPPRSGGAHAIGTSRPCSAAASAASS